MSKLQITTDVPNEIKLTRTFDAPKRLVLRAMTEPALIARWMGNSCSPIASVDVDFRVGGSYRYVFRNQDGSEFAFTGVYREIGDGRIVHTERFNDAPDESLVTTTLVEHAGVTTMTAVMRFSSQAIRDMVIGTGMERGAAESYDNLAALVASL
ncbi:MAG TPA: SRPBCC family protein [Kofleriaceae bacterium]|jgi:uncharacterized protein YndB with AHSA1/START domain|nr:SRPBCC family protein [Kofleriaceae bacterium]